MSATGINSALSSVVVPVTNSMIDFFYGPSFHEGSGSTGTTGSAVISFFGCEELQHMKNVVPASTMSSKNMLLHFIFFNLIKNRRD